MNWLIKSIAASCLVVLTNSLPTHAQAEPGLRDLNTLGRAENLARQAAEKANGGLQHYRAENSMYGPVERSLYTYDGNGSWTFTFRGHSPGNDTPTVESVVTVSRTSIVNVDYNGPIR